MAVNAKRSIIHAMKKLKPTQKELTQMYQIEEKSAEEIAEICGYSQRIVYTWLKKYHIYIRSSSEARLVSLKQGKFANLVHREVDETFFQKWTPSMAWVLGLYFTDGNIGLRNNSITLALNDRETVEKVKFLLNAEHPITLHNRSNRKLTYLLTFSRETIVSNLSVLGLKPNKSLNMLFPKVPAPFVRHFIRGCWDGDGGFTKPKNRGFSAHYTCGSELFIKRIRDELFRAKVRASKPNKNTAYGYEYCSKTGYPLTIHKRYNIQAYDIRIGSKLALSNLHEYLYAGVGKEICMLRKRQMLDNYLNITPESAPEPKSEPVTVQVTKGSIELGEATLTKSQKAKIESSRLSNRYWAIKFGVSESVIGLINRNDF